VCLANKVVVLMTGTASLATNKITLRQVNYSNVKILAIDTKTIDLDSRLHPLLLVTLFDVSAQMFKQCKFKFLPTVNLTLSIFITLQ
jgi:hypothetical protein